MTKEFEFVPQDLARVDLNDVYELRYWLRELKVGEGHLRAAVAAAGPGLAQVKKYLGIHDSPAQWRWGRPR